MEKQDLMQLLRGNSYPGRGIVLGLAEEGQSAMIAYFIMGRSPNSRNRVFTPQNEGIITQAADPAKLEDPSLILYAPVRVHGGNTIVTNGDQTDTIYNSLEVDGSFEAALRTRSFEPDAPNYTPRISGMFTVGFKGFSYRLSILKSNHGNPEAPQRFFFEYPSPLRGEGHFIHTYAGDGNPLPSFAGEPLRVAIHGDLQTFGESVWNSLNPENRVSLFVRSIHLDGSSETKLFNRFEKVTH